MMRLKNSRGLFFAKTREPRQSYWSKPEFVALVESVNGRPIPQFLLDWDPCAEDSRSNCPLLHDMLDALVERVDPRWRARAKNIYAGRTSSNVDAAAADHNLRGGMIVISNEYTSVLMAYVAMYGQYASSVDLAKTLSPADANAMWLGMRKHFDETIESYKGDGILSLKGNLLMIFPDEKYRESAQIASDAAEFWSIAHEFSHHLARDMSARRDKEVASTLRELLRHSSVSHEMQQMPKLHRDEVQADLLATLVVSGHFAPQKRQPHSVHLAITGAILALITIGHLRGEWTTEITDSHPGCHDRLRIILTVMAELYGNRADNPSDPKDRIYQFVAFLMTFVRLVEDGPIEEEEVSELSLPGAIRDWPPLFTRMAQYATDYGILADKYEEKARGVSVK